MIDFENLKSTQKGNLGESIVDGMLRDQGFVIYKPERGLAHAFDRLIIKNKQILLIAEVKTKAKRKYYPDTGIEYKHYKEYKNIMKKHNLEVMLFFVDEEMKSIYGGKLSDLDIPQSFTFKNKEITYPKVELGIIYFHIDVMEKYSDIDEIYYQELSELSNKKSDYFPDNNNYGV